MGRPWGAHWRGERGGRRRGRGGAARVQLGRHGELLGGAMGLLLSLLVRVTAAGCFVSSVRERRQEGGRRGKRK
jgi:hypothetical protein